MPSIGKLDRRITFQRASYADDGFTSSVSGWVNYVTVWAMRKDVMDGEKFVSGQVGSKLVSRFTIRESTSALTITPRDRISYDGFFWEIQGVKQLPIGRNRFLEVTAVRDAD